MKKILSFLTAILFAGSMMATDYQRVTSTADLVAGAKYVIGTEAGSFIATTSNTNNRKIATATVTDGVVEATEAMMVFTLGGEADAWTFATDNYLGTAGYLNATSTTGSNYRKVVATFDDYAYFTIAIAEDSVTTITCNGKESRHIMYLNGTTCFACYNNQTSAQYSKPNLYKEVTGGDDPAGHVYSVVGPLTPAGWDQTSTATEMTLKDGVYSYTVENVELAAGTNYEYKIVEDHAWTVAYPQAGNASFSVEKSGTYDVTFTLVDKTKEYAANPTLKEEGDVLPEIKVAGIGGDWTGEALTVAGDKKTASITKALEVGNTEFKIIAAGNWLSNAQDFTRENNKVEGLNTNVSDNMRIIADVAGNYTFTWTFASNTLEVTFPEKGDDPITPPAPTLYDTLYFVNTLGWATPYGYYWPIEVSNWPGQELTKTEDKVGNYDVYMFVAPVEKISNCVFNDGASDNTKQTVDLAPKNNDKYFVPSNEQDNVGAYKGTWYATLDAITGEQLAAGFYLIGQKGWTVADLSEDLKFAETTTANVYSLTVTLAKDQEIKAVYVNDKGEIANWMPKDGDNFVVTDKYAGEKTVLLNVTGKGGEGWFEGYLYVEPNPDQPAAETLNAFPKDSVSFIGYAWGDDVAKNVTIFDANNYIMMLSQGNDLKINATIGLQIGNSSKPSAFVFLLGEEADLKVAIARNGSDMTASLYYMGETVDTLKAANLAEEGTLCASANISADNAADVLVKAKAAAGYYKVYGTLRFGCPYIIVAEGGETPEPPTPEVIYSVAGSKALLGAEWNEKEGNEMTLDPKDGLYKLLCADVTLAGGTEYKFKIVTNHDWSNPNYPDQDKVLTVDKDGKYDVTITFNADTKDVAYVAEFKGGAVVEKHYLIVGDAAIANGENWNNAADINLMKSADEGLTYTLAVENAELAAETPYGYKVVEQGSWTEYFPNIGGDNAYFAVEAAGVYTITYTYTVATSQCVAITTKTGDIPGPVDPETPVDSMTVYFYNNLAWENVNAFVWNDEDGAYKDWSGEAAKKEAEQINDVDVYSYTFPAKYTKVIFNNAAETPIQTVDLVWDAEKPYFVPNGTPDEYGKYDGKWYAKADIPAGGETPAADFTKPFVLTFNGTGESGKDASAAFTADVAAIFDAASAPYVASVETATKVYAGRPIADDNSSVKFGTTSAQGSLAFTLAQAIEVDSIIVNATQYGNNAAKITINGTEFELNAGNKVPQDCKITPPLQVSAISIAQSTSERLYLRNIRIYPKTSTPQPTTYYMKNNWEAGADWTWKEMTQDGEIYKLENVVFGGTGVNYNTADDDEGAAWVPVDEILGDEIAAKDTVTFVLDPVKATVTATLIGKYQDGGDTPEPPTPEVIYSVAGSKALLGAEWNEKEGNEMTLDPEDGLYKLLCSDVTLAAETKYEFKIVTDHNWSNPNYPAANKELYVEKDGKYDVTITFNADTKDVAYKAEFKGGAVIEKHYLIVGAEAIANGEDWNNDADVNVMTTADEGLTYTLVVTGAKLIAGTQYGYKVVEKGSWTEYFPNNGGRSKWCLYHHLYLHGSYLAMYCYRNQDRRTAGADAERRLLPRRYLQWCCCLDCR